MSAASRFGHLTRARTPAPPRASQPRQGGRARSLGRTLTVAIALALTACSYDLDEVYRHALVDGGAQLGDGASDVPADAAQLEPTSSHLISAWAGYANVDRECIECAEAACAEENAACRGDQDCEAYTQCVGAAPHPQGQAECRGRFASWVSAGNVRERDLVGPYGQCVFRDRCVAQCEGNSDFACMNQFAWTTSSEPNIPLKLILVDAIDQSKLLTDVRVRVCLAGETSCAAPAAEAITDARGSVDLLLPTRFDRSFTGYLELTGSGIYPTLLKFGWNLGSATVQVVSVVNEALFRASIGAVQIMPDPTRGMLQLRMLGCNGVGVRGVSFSADNADPQTKFWYLQDGVPSLAVQATNAVGSGGIIDLQEGYTRTTAQRMADGVLVAESSAPVRAGFMTVVIFSPLAAQ